MASSKEKKIVLILYWLCNPLVYMRIPAYTRWEIFWNKTEKDVNAFAASRYVDESEGPRGAPFLHTFLPW